MTAENFEETLNAFCRRTPFVPFTVEFVSDARLQIDHPEALVFRGGVAVFVSRKGIPEIFDHEGVARLIGEREEAQAS